MATASTKAVGGWDWVIWLTYVNHCKDREIKQAKGAVLCLNQNGVRPGPEADVSSGVDVASSVYRWNLSYP